MNLFTLISNSAGLIIRHLPDSKIINKIVTITNHIRYEIIEKIHLAINRYLNRKIDYTIEKNPLISVYVPTYNRKEILLNRALPSILGQTYKNIEVIIVDDGSKDGTYEAVSEIKDPRIKVIRSNRSKYRYPNKSFYHWLAGPVEAANLGIQNCKGLWIARNDDDDIWDKEHLTSLLKYANEKELEIVSSNIIYKDTVTGERLEVGYQAKTKLGGPQTWVYKNTLKFLRFNIHCWRKNYYKVNDADFHYRVWRSGAKIGHLDSPTVTITQRPGENFMGSKAYLSRPGYYEDFFA